MLDLFSLHLPCAMPAGFRFVPRYMLPGSDALILGLGWLVISGVIGRRAMAR